MRNKELTKTEKEYLPYIHLSNKEIAKIKTVEITTVKSHINSIREKLQAKTRAEAIIIAIKSGLIKQDDFKTDNIKKENRTEAITIDGCNLKERKLLIRTDTYSIGEDGLIDSKVPLTDICYELALQLQRLKCFLEWLLNQQYYILHKNLKAKINEVLK